VAPEDFNSLRDASCNLLIERSAMPPPVPEKPRTSIVPLLLAGVLAVMVFAGLFFLTLGWMGPVLLIGMVIFGMGAFHYVVWGWWLSRYIRDDEEDGPHQRSDSNKEV
jgi:predicted membrane channel-forming protein YqfA (hemolysin III family)